MDHQKVKNRQRQRRRWRVRNQVKRYATRLRLCVFRSHKHIYAQVVDDRDHRTVASASTAEKAFQSYGGNRTAAEAIGQAIAERALAAGIKDVAFDRREYQYHGRVAALAEAARKAGLNF